MIAEIRENENLVCLICQLSCWWFPLTDKVCECSSIKCIALNMTNWVNICITYIFLNYLFETLGTWGFGLKTLRFDPYLGRNRLSVYFVMQSVKKLTLIRAASPKYAAFPSRATSFSVPSFWSVVILTSPSLMMKKISPLVPYDIKLVSI